MNLRFQVIEATFKKRLVGVVAWEGRPSEHLVRNVFNQAQMYKVSACRCP